MCNSSVRRHASRGRHQKSASDTRTPPFHSSGAHLHERVLMLGISRETGWHEQLLERFQPAKQVEPILSGMTSVTVAPNATA